MSYIKKAFPFFVLFFPLIILNGQETPLNPISYKLFNPFLFNPAITGSKDFFSADLLFGFSGKANSQIISGNTRIMKRIPGYVSSPRVPRFTRIGVGGSIFHDFSDLTRNAGINLAGAYHFQLDKKALSFLSIGASAKGIYHYYEGDSDPIIPSKTFYLPNFDAGIYFYNPDLYIGLSANNILGTHEDPDTLNTYAIPVSRTFFLHTGYKIVLSRSLDIVLEPSVIIVTDDSLNFDLKEMIKPALKLFIGNFCLGTYFNDFDKISFFFQFKYPSFYVGSYFEMPKNSPFYKKSLTTEIAVGINLWGNKSGYTDRSYW
jgi:type IX secretion system PorP/SprF family membrane protein